MKSRHSWTWLAPRFNGRHLRTLRAARAAISRPCLAIERLEDRDLLSAAGVAIGIEPPPSAGDAAVLVGLLKSGLPVVQDEFQLLKVLAGASPTAASAKVGEIVVIKTVDKASTMLAQLDSELVKVGEDLIKGQLTDHKLFAAENKIEYLKIKLTEVIVTSVDRETQSKVSPILDSLFADATSLVRSLLSIGGESTDSKHKNEIELVTLSEDVLKIDDLLLAGELDFLKGGSPGLDLLDFKSKIEGLFLKATEEITQLGEPVASSLLPAVQDFHGGIMNLLGSLSGGGDFRGGIVLPHHTDDSIEWSLPE